MISSYILHTHNAFNDGDVQPTVRVLHVNPASLTGFIYNAKDRRGSLCYDVKILR